MAAKKIDSTRKSSPPRTPAVASSSNLRLPWPGASADPHDPVARAKAIERVFSPSNPISDRALFAGRGAELQRVLAAVDAPGQHVVLFGERGVGKTSLANTIGALHGTRDRSPVVKIECSADLDAATLWRGLLSYLPAAGRPRVGFAGAARPESRLDLGDVEDLGPEQICRLLAEASRTGAPLLIIDEFDRINDPVVGRTLTDVMKAVSDRALPVTIMVVGVARNVETLLQEHASIVRCLVEVGMPRMSATELEEIVHPRLKRVQMNITPRALGWIVSLSQGFPHYTHVLAADAARVANEGFRDLITETDVDRAIQLAVERVQHSIAAAYERSVRSHRRENRYAEMLLASALAQVDQGRFFAPADLRQPLEAMGRRATLSSVGQYLKEFSGTGRGCVLERAGEARRYRYRFSDPLMGPYVVMRGLAEKRIRAAAFPLVIGPTG